MSRARAGKTGDKKRKYEKWWHFLKNWKAPRFLTWDKANLTRISLSLSLKTIQESLFKISFEHHFESNVPEHVLKIDFEVWLLAEKNYAASASCVTFLLVYVRMIERKFR